MIVPLTAGSAIDIVARLVFEQVSKQIGQTVVIENRSGASQTLGAGAVAKADPDGYTILVAGSALAVVPSTMANLSFNVQSDLVAVGVTCQRSAGDGGPAGQGLQDDARFRCRREGEAGHVSPTVRAGAATRRILPRNASGWPRASKDSTFPSGARPRC